MSAEPSSGARSRLPRHVAIIMDGNGRWAEQRGLPRLAGHREGAASVRDVVRAARQIGLEAITLYAFSSQNWGRPADEVAGLMELPARVPGRRAPGDHGQRHPAARDRRDRSAAVQRARGARRADGRLGRQPIDGAHPGAVVRRARVDRRRRAPRGVDGGRRLELSTRPASIRISSAASCPPATCRRSTWSSAPAASCASRTSSCGRRPTPSSTSRARSGPTSGGRTCTPRSTPTRSASAASA